MPRLQIRAYVLSGGGGALCSSAFGAADPCRSFKSVEAAGLEPAIHVSGSTFELCPHVDLPLSYAKVLVYQLLVVFWIALLQRAQIVSCAEQELLALVLTPYVTLSMAVRARYNAAFSGRAGWWYFVS